VGKEGILINLANLEEECHVPSMVGCAGVFLPSYWEGTLMLCFCQLLWHYEEVDMKMNCMFSVWLQFHKFKEFTLKPYQLGIFST